MHHECARADRRLTGAVVLTGITVLTPDHGPRAGLHAKLVRPSCGTAPTASPVQRPRSWVPSTPKNTTQTGTTDVQHQSNHADQGTPRAYLRLPDTVPHKQTLAAALGSTELAFRGGQGEAL
jgi:hypothetical protein